MKASTQKTLLIGGAGLAALYFLSGSSTSVITNPFTGSAAATPTGTTTSTDPSHAPVTSYAAALAENPNIGNSGYTLTDSEAQQYLSNYLDLRQGLATGGWGPNMLDNARIHWKQHGVPEKRIFVPMVTGSPVTVGSTVNYVPAQSNNKSSGSSSWIGSLISTAGTVAIALLGVNDAKPRLNDTEIEILFTGAPIALDILPMYYSEPGSLALNAESKLVGLLNEYS